MQLRRHDQPSGNLALSVWVSIPRASVENLPRLLRHTQDRAMLQLHADDQIARNVVSSGQRRVVYIDMSDTGSPDRLALSPLSRNPQHLYELVLDKTRVSSYVAYDTRSVRKIRNTGTPV